jgi:hypothetical protein
MVQLSRPVENGQPLELSRRTYPVDNNTYNLLQTLTSKLESIEVYQKYLADADDTSRPLFSRLLERDREDATQLVGALKQALP